MKATIADYAIVLAALQNVPERNVFADALALERLRGLTVADSQLPKPWQPHPLASEEIIEQARLSVDDPIAGLVALRAIGIDCDAARVQPDTRRRAAREVTRLGTTIVRLIAKAP